MKVKSEVLIAELIERTRQNMNEAEGFRQLTADLLNWKAGREIWSILECIEHLNLYGDYYLPEIERRISQANRKSETDFKPGFLGDYFAKSMLPKEKLNKMKTFKSKNPNGSKLDRETITRFLDQQKKMLELLDRARGVSLIKIKTGISISPLIKFKLGDTFRFVIYHNERHMVQAGKILAAKGLQVSAD
jgi:hypothetical protein